METKDFIRDVSILSNMQSSNSISTRATTLRLSCPSELGLGQHPHGGRRAVECGNSRCQSPPRGKDRVRCLSTSLELLPILPMSPVLPAACRVVPHPLYLTRHVRFCGVKGRLQRLVRPLPPTSVRLRPVSAPPSAALFLVHMLTPTRPRRKRAVARGGGGGDRQRR